MEDFGGTWWRARLMAGGAPPRHRKPMGTAALPGRSRQPCPGEFAQRALATQRTSTAHPHRHVPERLKHKKGPQMGPCCDWRNYFRPRSGRLRRARFRLRSTCPGGKCCATPRLLLAAALVPLLFEVVHEAALLLGTGFAACLASAFRLAPKPRFGEGQINTGSHDEEPQNSHHY